MSIVMKHPLAFIAILSCLLLMDTHLLRSQDQNQLATLSKYIEFKMQRDFIPGLAACIIRQDGIVWSRGFGFQNLDSHIQMTSQSVIGTASVSKLITAIAIMQLHERKKLNVDDPINKYLPFKIQHPKYPDIDITISQLLNHTASTCNGPSLWRCYSCEKQPLSQRQWVQAYFLPDGKYYHQDGNFGTSKPGEQFLYSNAGYALLAYIVEAVSGLPYNQYCVSNIFSPLKIVGTSFNVADIRKDILSTMYSHGYNMDLERDLMSPDIDCAKISLGNYFFPLCNYTTSTLGATGMYSSVEQLARLLIALMNDGRYEGNSILTKKSVARILGPNVDSQLLPGQFAAFGLGGYAMRLNNGALVWGHTGADPGQSSFLLFNTETKVGAIVLANRFVDIRDLIEWIFAEGIKEYSVTPLEQLGSMWKQYGKDQIQHKVTINVLPNYLPGNSQLFVIGNYRSFGAWVSSGVPLSPQKSRDWETSFFLPDSTKLEFKITRGGMDKQAVTMDGKVLPNFSFIVIKDTVVHIIVEDWKDQVQQ